MQSLRSCHSSLLLFFKGLMQSLRSRNADEFEQHKDKEDSIWNSYFFTKKVSRRTTYY